MHLHSHSEYSMLDGASRIPKMFARAKELGMPAVGLTDHGVMYGAIPFYLEGRATGIKPIIGIEAYVAPKSRFDRPAHRETAYHHLTMLSANPTGYRNLMQLSSLAFLEGYDSRSRRPRMDRELLAKFSDGVIVLSGCLSGELQKNLVAGKPDEARRVAAEYREIFGDRYFLEVQYQGLTQQPALNVQIAEIGRELGIPIVATNDSHYSEKEDAGAHDILLCIQMGKELADTDRMRFDTDQFYLKSREEMDLAFPEYPEAVENTLMVAELCDIEIPLHNALVPDFEVPEGETLASYLYQMTEQGVRRRYPEVTEEIEERMRHELSVIEQMGFPGYFLIVADFVQWAKSQGIRVGPGRGSVGGSMVAYALGITEIDPIRWGLGFERFLNTGRKQMPDIDIDFDERRRGEVIRYVSERYGEDRVAQIITFSTIKAKQALRDAARVLGLPYSIGDRLAKMYPPAILGKDAPFEACFDRSVEWPRSSGRNDAYGNAAELRKTFEEDQVSAQVIEAARKLEGLRRQHSIHAAGVVIGREPLVNHVPLQRTDADGEIVTQYEQNVVEQIGLLKMDFLGLRNLTVIEDTLAHVRNNRGQDADVDNAPLDDPKVFQLLQRGNSPGIFQMESPGMTRLLRQLRPDQFEEIAALIALYRPGPMDEISRYVKGKHEPSSVTYLHPLLRQVLADTNGVIVYQEQVTKILQVVGGFAPEAADMVRYAIGKKKSEVMAKAKTSFDSGCLASGLTTKETEQLWETIKPFAGYSFNRAHANGYAMVAYQTAWLKAHYPVEYMAALLTSVKANTDRMRAYLAECMALQIKVLPPDVNSSQLDFTPKGDQILFGLSAIRNVGEAVAESIVSARKVGVPSGVGIEGFASFHDFARRVPVSVLNKKVIESLARAGAFDALSVERSALLVPDPKGGLMLSDQAARVVEGIMGARRREDEGQFSLFGGTDPEEDQGPAAPLSPYGHFGEQLIPGDISRSDLLAAEKEMLGFYVSEHPLAGLAAALRYHADAEVSDLAEGPDGGIKTVGGILSKLERKFTRKGELMMIGTLEDMKGSVEVLLFPQTVNETPPGLLELDSIVLLKGRLDIKDDQPKLVALKVSAVDLSSASTALRIEMPVTACTPDRIEELKAVLAAHPGPSPVLLYVGNQAKTTVLRLGGGFTVEMRNGLYAELRSIPGVKALV
ncbi:MAG TPA: DNA polymerase III subunit alpha [Actinomycetota bacterium]|nr:DNA polymerase III subunit alpha [Actinomycetota bacterium]